MRAIAKFIVQKRAIFFILFAALIVYCAISIPKVKVEYDITTFLPPKTDTKLALDIMEDEFVTYGTATVMVKNITYDNAEKLHTEIKRIPSSSTKMSLNSRYSFMLRENRLKS